MVTFLFLHFYFVNFFPEKEIQKKILKRRGGKFSLLGSGKISLLPSTELRTGNRKRKQTDVEKSFTNGIERKRKSFKAKRQHLLWKQTHGIEKK